MRIDQRLSANISGGRLVKARTSRAHDLVYDPASCQGVANGSVEWFWNQKKMKKNILLSLTNLGDFKFEGREALHTSRRDNKCPLVTQWLGLISQSIKVAKDISRRAFGSVLVSLFFLVFVPWLLTPLVSSCFHSLGGGSPTLL
jgi:hypothetical protein